MKITKRDGTKEGVNLNKISKRINAIAKELNLSTKYVDTDVIAQKTVAGMYNNIQTSEIDTLAAETAAGMATHHPDYLKLAAGIEVSNLHKNTNPSYYERLSKLVEEKIVRPEILDKAIRFNITSDGHNDEDYRFNYFGLRTLMKSYLLRINGEIAERPQDLYIRVALELSDSEQEAKETYMLLRQHYYTHATPTLFNAGTHKNQLASCFLLDTEDSIKGIYKTLADCADISKMAGGIGFNVNKIRSKYSPIEGTGGRSNGIVPMLKVFNETARYVDQGGGKRKGSFAAYMEPWHADVFDFLELKRPHGKEENKARDLFLGLWMNDLFFERVKNDAHWTLFSPSEACQLGDVYGEEFDRMYISLENRGLGRRIKAQELWSAIISSQIESGVPYLLNKDQANEKSNQKNLGTIRNSNLCVSGDTQILTDEGYINMAENEGKIINAWNGEQWSKTQIVKTNVDQELIEVELSNGSVIKATDYHKWYIKNSYHKDSEVVRTKDLKIGDKLEKFSLPEDIKSSSKPFFDSAYTYGAFTADGTVTNSGDRISLYGYKHDLLNYLDIRSCSGNVTSNGALNVMLHKRDSKMYNKFYVPNGHGIVEMLDWLAGYLDFDGCLLNNNGTQSIQAASTNHDFLNEVMLMLQSMGVYSSVRSGNPARNAMLPDNKGGYKLYSCNETKRLCIPEGGVQRLLELQEEIGIGFRRLNPIKRKPNRESTHFVKVVGLRRLDEREDTYCVNEPLRNKVIFNGVLTGNCTEIIQYSSEDEHAVCNLASIALPKFVNGTGFDFESLGYVVAVATRNLNKAIDKTMYPTGEARKSNMSHRPIGLGVQGLADVFFKLNIAFDSPEAKALNKKIFEHIYFNALKESNRLARNYTTYASYHGSPISHGILQQDMWNDTDHMTGDLSHEWLHLREDIRQYGVINSLLVAPMPTASTASILGNTEAFEPITSNLYVRRVLAGEFIMINEYLVKRLIKEGLWSENMRRSLINSNGSVQELNVPQYIKDVYKTAYELSQKVIIDLAADRAVYIDQSQSMNLFLRNPNGKKLSSMYFYAWSKGLKTMQYYLRSSSAVDAKKITTVDCETCSS